MIARNMKEWRIHLMNQQKRFAMPIMTHPGIDMTGKKVIDAVTDGEIHFEAIHAMATHFPTLAATMMMDLTVEAEAFGCEIIFAEDEVPSVVNRVAHDHESVRKLAIPSLDSGRIGEYLRAGRLAAEKIHNKPVLGGCIGPFSLAGRLFDMTEIMTAAFMEPETIEALIEKCTLFLLNYVQEMKRSGMHGIIMAEPAAGLLDEAMCDRFSSAFIRRIVEGVQDDHFLFILHNCGNTGHVTRSMISTGAQGLHFGNRIDMIKTLQEVPGHILVFGNLDPVSAFKMASPGEIYRLASELLQASSAYPNFVLSSGCDTPPGVPSGNIHAFYDALQEYNKQALKYQLH
jgi:uroporphyrinogen decarboxylase